MPVSNRGRRSVAKRLESLGGIGEVAAIIDDTGRWYFATVLYDTTAVPDAIQQYCCAVVALLLIYIQRHFSLPYV